MTVYVLKGEKGFWTEENRPQGSRAIGEDLHQNLLEGEVSGRWINWNTSPPSLKDPELKIHPSKERAWRDVALIKFCAVRDRHRDEQELFRTTSLNPEQYVQLLEYIQKLRDWPQSAAFPDTSQRPMAPDWFSDQI
ncbi:phage tail assembly chaperone [Pseudomonas sp. NBRC 111130]|uniref:phage tail assembly chaperone n=1 Tax=Pseudomonas sp. NBRC 111130 TaxID=1661045 RepID=UPI0009E80A58|nr:phage tail assembly chaperone [Pseudomonas sp. NBRC 111130]